VLHVVAPAQGYGDPCRGNHASALIDETRRPSGDAVNIVAEKNIALNADTNFATTQRLLGMLDVRVNCRFVRRTSVTALRNAGLACSGRRCGKAGALMRNG